MGKQTLFNRKLQNANKNKRIKTRQSKSDARPRSNLLRAPRMAAKKLNQKAKRERKLALRAAAADISAREAELLEGEDGGGMFVDNGDDAIDVRADKAGKAAKTGKAAGGAGGEDADGDSGEAEETPLAKALRLMTGK